MFVCPHTLGQSVIFYNSKTRTLKEDHKRKLGVFGMTVLKKISGFIRRDRVRNFDILKDFAIDKDVDILHIGRLTYFGHVIHMAPCRYPHISLHPRERPRKKWMYNIREDCADMDMFLIQASRLVWDMAQWRSTIRKKG